MEKHTAPHEHIGTGISLSLLGGFLDAYSYLLKGGVFANAQTGNLVLLFLAFAGNQVMQSVRYIIPICAFAFGVLLAELVKSKKLLKPYAGIQAMLIVESALILLIAFFGTHCPDSLVNSVLSFAAAIQAASFDRINGSPVATTMITGDLKSGTTALAAYLRTKDASYGKISIQYLIIICSFGAGVAAGKILIHLFAEYAILFCLLFTAATFTIIQKNRTL